MEVEYATYQMNSQLFVQKYQLYLPDGEELRRQLEFTLKQRKQAHKTNSCYSSSNFSASDVESSHE